MIAIDVGCAPHGADSIGRIIEEYHPSLLIGLDPHPSVSTNIEVIDGTTVVFWPVAAWVEDGWFGYVQAGLGSHLDPSSHDAAKCVDLAKLIASFDDSVLLKIDAEGAEYDLLPHLLDRGCFDKIALTWVEWHQPDRGRAEIEASIPSHVEQREWLL